MHKFFDKKTGSGISVNEQLDKKLHKPIIKKFKWRKVYARFKDNIWTAGLAEIESLSSNNKNDKYLLCHRCFQKGETVLNAFIEIVNESNHKPNKLWVDQGREFYNKLIQEWLDINDVLMYSTHNEGKSVIAEMFIKTLKAKIYKRWQLILVNLIFLI